MFTNSWQRFSTEGKKMKKGTLCGLTTYDALEILHDDIQRLLKNKTSKRKSRWTNLKDIFDVQNEHSALSWISIFLICLNGFVLIFTSFFVNSAIYGSLILQGIFILVLAAGNVGLIIWDNSLRQDEIPAKIENLLTFVKECQDKCMWRPENYPHLCSPYSPCITLQWTYRDGTLVNLPWALLCRGDVILLRPGQTAPGDCCPHDTVGPSLSTGEVYSPPQKHDNISMPTARVPLANRRYVMQETPLLRNVEEVLDSAAVRRTVTSHDRQRHLVISGCVLHLILPLFAVCTVLVNILRYIYVGQWVGSSHWSVMFLLMPSSVSLPLLPLTFPAAWLALNAFGTAKLSAFLQSSYSTKTSDPFDDISMDEQCTDEALTAGTGGPRAWGRQFLRSLLGQQHSLALVRSVNPLHILGSVTALCCVDKKGILSWPNPTAEKVFFLRTSKNKSHEPSQSSLDDTNEDILEDIDEVGNNGEADTKSLTVQHGGEEPTQTVSEVLDLTHDLSCPFRLHFDDTRWKEYMGSLRPIGLAILLNTCNMATQEHYVQFCSHVTCEALYNEDLVPVTNRRCPPCVREVSTLLSNNKCLCELSKQIGFTDDVVKSFTLLEQLSTFRHVQPEAVRRDIKFARSLALATKLKLPFPHMVCVVTSEAHAPRSLQLFSQATGDIALDSCVDFWDGTNLRVLSSSDRKKVLDFYQRTSLTAYCTAFAYRPLSRGLSHALTSVYMELPPDSHHLYLRSRSPTPLIWPHPNLSQSIDSLFSGDVFEEEVSDIEGCFETQCNQIFLGMVTMQYQAQIEMVQLIEQLEGVCIRFVHFSKENELRSRVFSEKMGLESGWNCHVSLLSNEPTEQLVETEEIIDEEDNCPDLSFEDPLLGPNVKRGSLEGSKTISVSAPSAINTESVRPKNELNPSLKVCEEDCADSNSQHDGWQSLSCLTDSTEQSAHINFDMSNRAKLPRGIDQIRPHLENVDNVPLLVSLFTDCTPATTRQMIAIMQDYGEVVCVIGSSANADNCGIFLKADASVSMEPLYPQVCQKVPVYTCPPDTVSPIQLSQRLNSLPCSVEVTREQPVSLFHFIMHARHYMQCIWNCIQFWVCCCVTLSAVQVTVAIVMLPPLFTTGEVLWLSCIVVPPLAVSLVFAPTNLQVMQRPASKNQFTINSEVAIFALWCYGCKLLPTLLVVPLVYGATLASHCHGILAYSRANRTTSAAVTVVECSIVYPRFRGEASLSSWQPWGGWQYYLQPLINAQLWCNLLLVFHFCIMSISFVHREHLTWRRSPFKNKVWLAVSISMLVIQSLYTIISLVTGPEGDYDLPTPWIGVGVALSSLPLIFIVNEFFKWQEIKANVRYEKRARLEFGTKLGMNSPF